MKSSLISCLTRAARNTSVASAAAVVAAIVTLTSTAQADTILRAEDIAPFRVSYSVGNNVITAGQATLELAETVDGVWRFKLETRPTGVFRLTGKGNVAETSDLRFVPTDDDGFLVRPDTYRYRQDDERRRAVDASFDWEDMLLSWTRRGKSDSISLAENPASDRLSVMLAVMSSLRQNEYTSEHLVFDSGKLKRVIFEVQGEDRLETSLGPMDTIRVLRRNLEGSSRTTVTWFAPSLDYMPVKIEQLKRGDLVARLTLRSLSNATTEIDEPLIAEPGAETEAGDR